MSTCDYEPEGKKMDPYDIIVISCDLCITDYFRDNLRQKKMI